MAALCAWYLAAHRATMRQEAETDLKTIGDLKIEQLRQWRQERLADAAVLQGDRVLTGWVTQALMNQDAESMQLVRRRFDLLRTYYGYRDTLLVDAEGKIVLSAVQTGTLHPQCLADMKTALTVQRPQLSNLHSGDNGLNAHEAVIIPYQSEEEPTTTSIGAILLVQDAADYLFPIVESWPTPSRTAESLIVRRDGDQVLFLNHLRHRDYSAESLRLPIGKADLPATMAVNGRAGIVSGIDYRDQRVIAYVCAVPYSTWFMVVKMDEAEALSEFHGYAFRVFALLLVAGFLVVVVGAFFWQRHAKQQFRDLYRAERQQRESTQRYAVTLMSIGDGVIVVDTECRVELLNPEAERLTGWTQDEAQGKPLQEIFPIINEDTRQEVENPVARVLRENCIVGLANHTLLLSRDGREIPIADSGAPIQAEGEAVGGVVLVFRDQTVEREARRELNTQREHAELLLQTAAVMMIALDREGMVTLANQQACAVLGAERSKIVGASWFDTFVTAEDRESIRSMFLRVMAGEGTMPPHVESSVLSMNGESKRIRWHNAVVSNPNGEIVGTLSSGEDLTDHDRLEEEQAMLQAQLLQSQKMEAVGKLAGGVAHDFNNMLTIIIGQADMAIRKVDANSRVHKQLGEIAKAAERSANLTRQLLAFARRQTVQPQVLDLNITVEGMLKMLKRLIGEDIDLVWKPGGDLWYVKADPAQFDQILANLLVNARDAIGGVGKVTIETTNAHCDASYRPQDVEFEPGDYVMLAVSDSGMGMSKATLSQIFEPFFTTKEVGKGSGLGLSTVFGIVKQNMGFINVYSEVGQGTTFRIYLPRCLPGEAVEQAETVTAFPLLPHGHETVLVVEDEASILELACDILKDLGYTVLSANSPQAALELVDQATSPVDLLVTDVIMPEMNGRDLCRRLVQEMPGLRCLFMSGYTSNVIVHHGVLDEGIQFMEKPFTPEVLAKRVREVLDD